MAAIVLVAAVGLAFADASVVALALTELYSDFDTTIVGVSWVLTAYAVAVAAIAVPLSVVHARTSPRHVVAVGAGLFGAASMVAGFAGSLGVLLAARTAQGLGAALLLSGSLPLLGGLTGDRARRWWATAGAVGTAAGPAVGGLLTQALSWRAIFFVQAPVAALALVAAITVRAPGATAEVPDGAADGGLHAPGEPPSRRGAATLANIAFALLFAALVAALFLSVLLIIDVWRYEPLAGALLVSALPVGMAVGRLAASLPAAVRAGAGGGLVALGLLGLGLLPGQQPVLAALALASCGAGFDLLHAVLDEIAVVGHRRGLRAAATSVGARHAGLALGLLVIAPVLAPSVDHGVDRATLGATRTMLDSSLPLTDKIPIAWDLRGAIEQADRGQVPDLGREFDERGASDDDDLARTRDDLVGTVTDALTRAFRSAFVVAAILAALAAIPALVALRRRGAPRPARPSPRAGVALVALVALGAGTVVGDVGAGGIDSGEYEAADPCARSSPRPGGGADATVQRITLDALDGAACQLGTSREVVVLSIDPHSGYDVRWDHDTIQDAVRAGAHRAIDEADDRDEISGLTARVLRFAVDHTPVEKLLDAISAIT